MLTVGTDVESILNILSQSIPEAIGALLAAGVITLFTLLKRKDAKLKNLNSLGVDNIFVDRHEPKQQRPQLFKKAKRILIHSIYIDLEHSNLLDVIRQAIQDNKSVKILILSPESEYISSGNPLQLANMAIDISKKIKEDIHILKSLVQEHKQAQWNGEIKVKLYNTQPMWSIYLYDDEIFASPYLYRTEGGDTPCIHALNKMSGRTPYAQFERHFQRLWDASDDCDFERYSS